MKIIIAPSKTMTFHDYSWTSTPLIFPDQTAYLHSILKEYNDEDLCHLMKISPKQAQKVYDYFHQPQTKHPALAFYQGTVFKELALDQYQNHLDYLTKYLRILSAYYGVLQYNTGIMPYRLDMTMKPNHLNLYEYWYTPIYQYFENDDFIISLASMEFMQMVRHPHMYFIDFIELQNNQIKKYAMIIKKARGQMLNQMIIQEITTLNQLQKLNIDGFTYQPSYNRDHTLAFVRKKLK